MPKEMLEQIPGYGPDINANREEAQKLMQKAGYGPDKHLAVKVSTRNIPIYRDPAVILIDQLKSIYIDGELDVVDTAQWFPKVARKDYALGLNLTGNAVDDPDQSFYENYSCGSERNYTNYCNKDIEKLFDEQSAGDRTSRQAQEAGLGDRQEVAGGRRAVRSSSTAARAPAGSLTGIARRSVQRQARTGNRAARWNSARQRPACQVCPRRGSIPSMPSPGLGRASRCRRQSGPDRPCALQ